MKFSAALETLEILAVQMLTVPISFDRIKKHIGESIS